MEYNALTPGRLLRRYKRFLADVELEDGEIVVAHCPNTGSMRSVNVPGCRVWLAPSTSATRKLAWTWELIELPQPDGTVTLASVHTGRANAIVEEALRNEHVPELRGYATLRREASVAGGRLDFRLDDVNRVTAFVEVKHVTLRESDGHGYFPASVTTRGTRHLESLRELVAAGQRAVMLFCVANTGITSVAPAEHIDPVYAQTLRRVAEEGVEVLAYACHIDSLAGVPRGIRLDRSLPVSLTRTLAGTLS